MKRDNKKIAMIYNEGREARERDSYYVKRERARLDYFLQLCKLKGYDYALEWFDLGDEVPSGGMILE